MAGPIREKIRLVSSAGTGHFTPPPRTSVSILKRWKPRSMIRSCVKHVAYKEAKIK